MDWEPLRGHRGYQRHRVAHEAARILYYREQREYLPAKQMAARKLPGGALPGNTEVRQRLLAIARRQQGAAYAPQLNRLRQHALEVMEWLAPFHPYLVGSVWTGHIRPGSDIDIHVFSDSLEAVQQRIQLPAVQIEKAAAPGGQVFTHIRFQHPEGETPVELTVMGRSEAGRARNCSITGLTQPRANREQLQHRLATETMPTPAPVNPALLAQAPSHWKADLRHHLEQQAHPDDPQTIARGVERFAQLISTSPEPDAVYRFLFETGDRLPLVLLGARRHLPDAKELLEVCWWHYFEKGFLVSPALPVSYEHLLEQFPGQQVRFGSVLHGLEEAYICEEFQGLEDGLDLAGEWLDLDPLHFGRLK